MQWIRHVEPVYVKMVGTNLCCLGVRRGEPVHHFVADRQLSAPAASLIISPLTKRLTVLEEYLNAHLIKELISCISKFVTVDAEELQVGDYLDVCDKADNTWWAARVLEKDGPIIRVKYVGWSDYYNSTFYTSSICLAPLGSRTRQHSGLLFI